ncbi:hypothetical protein SCHPADRAFT_908696 [Schizopora paradoxa]|uniref:Uncharacterized protein n=1 Tax=Schizopora paradoxa TaxID=27342 RepID=A0A0H2RAA9_9AGAM|nr:hypothetical protein SCHPADRAFT_908696 [Schizopora paradoxa]
MSPMPISKSAEDSEADDLTAGMATCKISPSRGSCFIERLPVEVLLHMLAFVTSEFDPSRQEPSIDIGDCNPWAKDLRTKKVLNRVCRSWHDIATPYLYDRIYLHRIGQLVALVKVLEKSTFGGQRAGYAPLIHHIHGRFLVPPNWEDIYDRYVVRLLELCDSVWTFSWRPVWRYPNIEPVLAQCSWVNIMLLAVLSARQTLGSLRKPTLPLNRSRSQDHMPVPEADFKLTLENLEDLTCEASEPVHIEGLSIIASSFIMPKIRKLKIDAPPNSPLAANLKVSDPQFIYGILETHGAKLSSLTLGFHWMTNGMMKCVSSILDLTPALKELQLSSFAFNAFNPDHVVAGPYPNLQKLKVLSTVWCIATSDRSPNRSAHLENYLVMAADRKALPSLRTVGLLDRVFASVPLDGIIPLPSHQSAYTYLSEWAEKLSKRGITLVDVDDEIIAPTGSGRWIGRFVPSRSLEEDVHSDLDDLSFPSDDEEEEGEGEEGQGVDDELYYESSEYSSWDSEPEDGESDSTPEEEEAYSDVGSTEAMEIFENSLDASDDEDLDVTDSE